MTPQWKQGTGKGDSGGFVQEMLAQLLVLLQALQPHTARGVSCSHSSFRTTIQYPGNRKFPPAPFPASPSWERSCSVPSTLSKDCFIVICRAGTQIWYRYWIKPCTPWQSNFILTCWLLALHLCLLSQRGLSERSCIFFFPFPVRRWHEINSEEHTQEQCRVCYSQDSSEKGKKLELRFVKDGTKYDGISD